MIQVYTGNGKGKTTAALGLAMRAAGRGWRVLMIQFMKYERCGEHIAAERLAPELTILRMGYEAEDETGTPGPARRWVRPDRPAREDVVAAETALHHAAHIVNSREYDMVILDEILTAVEYGLITVKDVLILIRTAGEKPELVLTGRSAPAEVIDAAHLVTEMRAAKHYYDSDTQAREGIEF